MTKEQSCVSIKNLSLGYEHELLRVSSLELRSGELVALLGPNGIGKSTLLKTIAGLTPALNGSISLCGRELRSLSAKEIARMVSFVFTQRPKNSLLVEEIVALGRFPWLGFMGKTTEVDRQLIKAAITKTRIESFLNKRLHELSDGEQQKVMLAKALSQNGSLMILDEPMAFLDVTNKILLNDLLRSVASDDGKCVLMSTHEIQMALDVSDKIILVSQQDIWVGKPEELRSNDILEKAFAKPGLRVDKAGRVVYQ